MGGYVASTSNVINMLRNFGGGFSFTTSLPPTDMAAALASVRILRSEEGRKLRHQLQANTIYLFQKLLELGIPAMNYSGYIAAIHVIFMLYLYLVGYMVF